uniref:Uncharacterized protein n=1 Tax=Timema monikensis TaxID=170555 RepID=A0A7R9HT59_9NEOP|nr:unnamed protein product [Timema monikensis]
MVRLLQPTMAVSSERSYIRKIRAEGNLGTDDTVSKIPDVNGLLQPTKAVSSERSHTRKKRAEGNLGTDETVSKIPDVVSEANNFDLAPSDPRSLKYTYEATVINATNFDESSLAAIRNASRAINATTVNSTSTS